MNFKNHKPLIFCAPMAGISDSPARKIARNFGADAAVSGLISAEGLIRKTEESLMLAKFESLEHPLGIQLFGSDPDLMAEAACIVEVFAPDFIDLNFGCPVRKVVAKNGGSSILRDLNLFERIVSEVVKRVDLPITVKIRSGWDANALVFLEAGKAAEKAGAAAIFFHPRTKAQGFKGQADWEMIGKLKQAVGIPVIGNGDITKAEDAQRMLSLTGCDGVMIGRAARGNPWIFRDIKHYLSTGESLGEPSLRERVETAIYHFNMMIDHYGLPKAVWKMRTHFGWYLRGFVQAAKIRNEINNLQSPDKIKDLLYSLCEETKAHVKAEQSNDLCWLKKDLSK